MRDILTVRGARKSYGAVKALRGADLSVRLGEVHAVCGDNGAGKSTLIKLIAGVEMPDEGVIEIDGSSVQFAAPHDALASGIATIHQDLGLVPRMTIYENIFLGSELRRKVAGLTVLDRGAMIARARGFLAQLGSSLSDMKAPVDTLSGGQRQAVAICRALRWQARIIIMDEPTAALGVRETGQVLDLVGRLRQNGVSVILVSHNMNDVAAVANRITVLHAGRSLVSRPVAGLDGAALSQMILSAGQETGAAP